MLTEKRLAINNSSHYRISAAKPINAKHTSNRSISIAHTGTAKKEFSPTHNLSSLIVAKNTPMERIYSNPEKQYYVKFCSIKQFYLGKGNNEDLVRRVLKTRGMWVEKEDSTNAFIHFKWQQDQKGYKYNRLVDSGQYRCVLDQLEFHECLTNKEHLFKNLEAYCIVVPPTFVLNSKDEVNMQHLEKFFDLYEKYLPKKIKNAHPELEKEMLNYKKKLKTFFFNCNLKKNLPKLPKLNENFIDPEGEYLWIIKPTFLNRGRGIKVFSKLETLYKYIEENVEGYVEQPLNKEKHTEEESPTKSKIDYVKRNSECIKESLLSRDPANREVRERKEPEFFDGNQYIRIQPKCPSIIKTDKFLVQKYLERPLLIMDRKFDIRIWVLVAHNLKCYVFKEGYIRLSSMEYSVKDDENNTFRHLTNNAIQKFSGEYGEIAEGNQLPFSKLREVMSEQSLNFDESLTKIHSHITLTLKSVQKFLNPNNRKFQFEIYGYDFMIDQSGHPWLIEVNNNPCIEESSTLLKHYMPRMLNDAFKLTLDQLFWGSVSSGRFPVEGYKDEENMWQKLDV